MTHPMPPNAPELMRTQAELQDLRWVAREILTDHDRAAALLSDMFSPDLPRTCQCSLCRHARPWVVPEPRYCTELDERRAVS